MTTVERDGDRLTLRVRPDGVARYAQAGFLAVWLCFWAVGETVVGGVLAHGALSLLQGQLGVTLPMLAVGAFLLVWVAFWTFGGFMAGAELLRLISSEETLVVAGDRIDIKRRRGPFTWTRATNRASVRRVHVAPRRRMLVFETGRRAIEFAPIGGPEDERKALDALRDALGLSGPAGGEVALPDGWEETLTPDGERVVVRDTRARKKQAMVMFGIAAFAWALALLLAWRALVGPAVATTVFAAIAGGWGWWLDQGRQEIKVGGGRLVVRRRWRGQVRDLYEAGRLELFTRTDSDGDVWYRLEAISNSPLNARGTRARRTRLLASAMNDPFEPRALGAWLAVHAGVPYHGADP